ncbi:GNAT family N-acetyltransferase [Marinobacter mobilis]|uniref:GNAT family N-acetyltransferase n=1 Tax=Marinobacter mobilis TaxID=488533 RepID=UPI0035C72165
MSLFQSKAWQDAWWNVWGNTPGFQRISEGKAGSSGVYLDCYRLFRCLPVRCFQFVGTNYRRLSTPRTEYNTFCPDPRSHQERELAISEMLDVEAWGEAVFRDVREDAPDLQVMEKLAAGRGWLVRSVSTDRAYAIDTRGRFEDYLANLGRNTRLKLFNRRKLLAEGGSIELQNAWPNRVDEFFELLNRFHRQRWGGDCFNGHSLRFHKQFLRQVGEEGGAPDLSLLTCNGQVISVLYNVCYKGNVYNLQSGYIEDFHRKIALGTLHLGYSIESAFRNPGVYGFDMLAGTGKNDNYKVRLATLSVGLQSIMLVRSPLLKALYRLKDRLTSG